MVDSSGNGNDGTTNNIISVTGFSGNGYHFDGSSSVVTVPSSASLNPGSADIKVTVHVNFNNVPSGDFDLIRKGLGPTSGGDYKMEILHSGQAFCLFARGGRHGKNYSIRGGPNLADGSWHTISCVKTASSIQLIVDGTVYPKSAKVGSISNSAPLTIGARKTTGGDWYLGDMDEVAVEIG